jgi:hypothetical protein
MQDKTVVKATSYNCINRPCPICGENCGEETPDKSEICHSHNAKCAATEEESDLAINL